MLDSLDTTARSAAEAASAAQASTLPLDTLSGACARSVSSSGDESAAAAEPVSALEAFGAQAVLAVVEPMLEHCTQAQPPLPSDEVAGLSSLGGRGAATALSSTLSLALSSTLPAEGGGGKALSHAQRAVFLLNVVEATAAAAAAHGGHAGERARAVLRARSESLLAALVSESANLFFARCDLLPRLDALRTAAEQPHLRVSSVVGLEPLALAGAMRAFDAQLFQSGDALMPFADRVASADMRHRARQGTAAAIAATYRDIHALVNRDESGYEDPKAILTHSPEEVETLLDVAGT